MTKLRDKVALVLAGVLCVAAIVGGQAVTDAAVPAGIVTGTGTTVGRAAFSYLAGLRAFAAYELWNRLEPQLHQYYEKESLKQQLFAVPTMSIVIALKPDFVPPYYVLPWVLIGNGKTDQGMEIARLGVQNNPRSGLLIMAYAQLLALKHNDWKAAALQSDAAMRSDTYWADDTEKHDSLRVAEDIYNHLGDAAKSHAVVTVLDSLTASSTAAATPDALGQAHDHNGDGIPDH